MRTSFFDFEEPILGIKQRIQELESFPATEGVDFSAEIANLHAREEDLLREIYAGLNPWQIVQVARHPLRPYFLDYVRLVCDEFIELHGDRLYGDDKAIVGGFASIGGVRVVILGQQKGRGCVKESIARNFGMAKPEGYRKALRLMKLAEKFKLPIVTIIDTPGAYPGIDAEERGQSEAIARNLREMSLLATPILSIVIGEGGSGGALGIGVCDRLLMLQNSMYSVISPEGCASILWHDATKAEDAAKALGITASELHRLGIVDEVLAEPPGGAHRNPTVMAYTVKQAIHRNLGDLMRLSKSRLLEKRSEKLRNMGPVIENLV